MAVARETLVAAGIPMSVTTATATTVGQARESGGMRDAIRAQSKTVAKAAHVPGPGLIRPMPRKVATWVDQSGGRGRDAPETAGGTPALRRESFLERSAVCERIHRWSSSLLNFLLKLYQFEFYLVVLVRVDARDGVFVFGVGDRDDVGSGGPFA